MNIETMATTYWYAIYIMGILIFPFILFLISDEIKTRKAKKVK